MWYLTTTLYLYTFIFIRNIHYQLLCTARVSAFYELLLEVVLAWRCPLKIIRLSVVEIFVSNHKCMNNKLKIRVIQETAQQMQIPLQKLKSADPGGGGLKLG